MTLATHPLPAGTRAVLEQLAVIFDARLVEDWERPLPPAPGPAAHTPPAASAPASTH